jgi:hypothetical protein
MLQMRFNDATQLRLKTVAKSKLTLRCPKHTRYNPAEGRGAIRGCCAGCEAAFEAYEAVLALTTALARYVAVTEKFETAKPRQKKVKPTCIGAGA